MKKQTGRVQEKPGNPVSVDLAALYLRLAGRNIQEERGAKIGIMRILKQHFPTTWSEIEQQPLTAETCCE